MMQTNGCEIYAGATNYVCGKRVVYNINKKGVCAKCMEEFFNDCKDKNKCENDFEHMSQSDYSENESENEIEKLENDEEFEDFILTKSACKF